MLTVNLRGHSAFNLLKRSTFLESKFSTVLTVKEKKKVFKGWKQLFGDSSHRIT